MIEDYANYGPRPIQYDDESNEDDEVLDVVEFMQRHDSRESELDAIWIETHQLEIEDRFYSVEDIERDEVPNTEELTALWLEEYGSRGFPD